MNEGDEKVSGELFGGVRSARSRVRTRPFGQKAVCPFAESAILLFLIEHEANEAERARKAI